MKILNNPIIMSSFILSLLFLIPGRTTGQSSNLLNNNSLRDPIRSTIQSITEQQKAYLKSLYSGEVEAPKELINGKEYISYYLRSEVKPLLFQNKVRTASILTKTRRYDHLTLQYDTFLDEVIYTDTGRTVNYTYPQISLNKDIVEGFNLYFVDDSLIFRYFRLPGCASQDLKEGFYEVAYEGKSKYIIKHESTFYEREGLSYYKYSPENYVSLGGKFVVVKNKKSLLRLFGEKSGVVKNYLRSSRIRIRQADKSQFVSILKFYDSL